MAIALTLSNGLILRQNSKLMNQWPQNMAENIWLFNQCAGLGAPLQTSHDKSGKVYLQREREYIARFLESAALRISQDLNYYITPMYFTETMPLGSGRPYFNQIFQAKWLKMIALGQKATSVIQAGATVTYTDPNNIGVNDTATITVNTTVADDEIRLFFRTADGAPSAAEYRYEIEPITVSNNGAGVVTITAHRALFVSPRQWAREYLANDPNFNSPNIIDTSQAANFVTAVDVYREYTDNTAAVQLLDREGTALTGYTGEIVDYDLSAFRIGVHCADYSCCNPPTQVRVHYKAGSPLFNNNIDSELYDATVALASANMPNKHTGMSYWALENWLRWHEPLIENGVPVATSAQASSKYGARHGQIYAWGVVSDRAMTKAGKITYNMRH